MGAKKLDLEKNGSAMVEEEEEEVDDRGKWASPAEFILSCIGYAVGLGNVWRFPYLCYENGGAAFLIPYFIMLTFVGIPVFLIELSVGQYSASGPATVWEAIPMLRGVGFGMLVISFISSIYYNVIIAWSIYYLGATFQSVLPWQDCTNSFNTEACWSRREASPCMELNGTWFNQTCYNETSFSGYSSLISALEYINSTNRSSPTEEYFKRRMLAQSDSIEDSGAISWEMTLCLLAAWVICYLCIVRGIRSSGKVVYFTATFPYLLLLILFFRAVTLPGALEGIKFYIIPKWEKLATPKVWGDAAGQIFFSLSVGTGGLMTFASYNKFKTNVYRDTLIVSVGNCLTSVFAGFVIFSILGFMAVQNDVTVDKVASSGSGLAFVAYPEVVTWLPLPQLWSFLFFFMLLTLGLDSQFASLENIQTAITDTWPTTRKYKWVVSGVLCLSMFLLGLTQCLESGFYWTEIMSYYSSGWALVIMGAIEGIAFPWIYGADRLLDDIEAMCGFRLWRHWWVCWKFITPILLILILIINFIDFTPLAVGSYVIESWAQALGWCMAIMTIVGIPFFFAWELYKTYQDPELAGRSVWGRIAHLSRPSKLWMPANEKGLSKSAIADSVHPLGLDHINDAYHASNNDIVSKGDTKIYPDLTPADTTDTYM